MTLYKGIVISPDGIKFKSDRPALLLSELASKGYLCLYFNQGISDDYEKLEDGLYYYNDESMLLHWLTKHNVKPIILCTWLLQQAWTDLLKQKQIWYDICDDEDVLWGFDAKTRLNHFKLLKSAELVTYSDRKFKKYTSMRKDALLVSIQQVSEAIQTISGELRGGMQVEQRNAIKLHS